MADTTDHHQGCTQRKDEYTRRVRRIEGSPRSPRLLSVAMGLRAVPVRSLRGGWVYCREGAGQQRTSRAIASVASRSLATTSALGAHLAGASARFEVWVATAGEAPDSCWDRCPCKIPVGAGQLSV